jgi:glycosyltransferase involved in cell wall biosynthesis
MDRIPDDGTDHPADRTTDGNHTRLSLVPSYETLRLPTSSAVLPYDRRSDDRRRSMVVEKRRVAVLLPCRNEETTIGDVVRQFRAELPDAQIWVYDNGSDDGTGEIAEAAGALVRYEAKAGKGNVVRKMFAQIDADIYVMADGDSTYDASAAQELINHLIENQLDMVVGRRREAEGSKATYRAGHRLGNAVLSGVVSYSFGSGSVDMLSGYRVLSRRYVKSFPAASRGFEIETEMTVHALDLDLPFDEVDTAYAERPPNSHSKLRTIPDGIKILVFIALLLKEHRPATFFGVLGGLTLVAAAITRLVLYQPIIRASSGALADTVIGVLVGVAAILLLAAVILDSMSRSRREMKRLMYLRSDAPGGVPMKPQTETRKVPR